MYIVAGGLYTVAALLGYFISHFRVLNTRDKRIKILSVILFIVVLLLTLLVIGKIRLKTPLEKPRLMDMHFFAHFTNPFSWCSGTIFVQSILLSSNVVDIPLDDQLRGELACTVAQGSCSFCNNEISKPECPEWTGK